MLTTVASPDVDTLVVSGGDDGTLVAWELSTGVVVETFKGGGACGARAIAAVHGRVAAHCMPTPQYLVACQADRPFMHVWAWGKDQPHFKCASPERMLCTVATSDGGYLFGGAASGRIFVWEISTGNNLGSWFAHYKAVSSLALTSCCSVLVSGGEDAVAHAWTVADVLEHLTHGAASRPSPLRSFSNHTLPVTSVRCGIGRLACRIFTTSLDRVVNVYGLHTSHPLLSVVLPAPAVVSACDALETLLFVGGGDGVVYQIDLHGAAAAKAAPATYAGGVGAPSSDLQRFKGHSKAVTDLCVSPSGTALVSSSEDGTVRVWDVKSRQVTATVDVHKAPVRALLLMPHPGRGEAGAGASGRHRKHAGALLPFAPLRKQSFAAGGGEAGGGGKVPLRVFAPHGIPLPSLASLLPITPPSGGPSASPAPRGRGGDAGGGDTAALQARVRQLEEDNARWQVVNNALIARLAAGAGTSAGAGAGAGSEGAAADAATVAVVELPRAGEEAGASGEEEEEGEDGGAPAAGGGGGGGKASKKPAKGRGRGRKRKHGGGGPGGGAS